MKTIGLIGGLSWQSTLHYYRILNEETQKRLGGKSSARILLHSVNFAEMESSLNSGGWPQVARETASIARNLQEGGAEMLLLCANTMHIVADQLESSLRVPLVHIVDVAAEELRRRGIRKAALLGTRFTMSDPFYRDRLASRHGIHTLVPSPEEIEQIHQIIHLELILGKVMPESRNAVDSIIDRLHSRGAEAVILACTELPMLYPECATGESTLPMLDTLRLHARRAVELALL